MAAADRARARLLELYGSQARRDPVFAPLFEPLDARYAFLTSEQQLALQRLRLDHQVRLSKASGVLVLAVALLVAALDAGWIIVRWALGLDYPGGAFVRAIALENALAFAVVIGLVLTGVLPRSRAASDYAYIAMFAALGWCAFPLLGRFDL
jgi:hypothetical protein